ncbi:MAG: ubiquinol-cytochrome C chaperone family protein [Alphaproteobacteria bacterium]
MQASAWSRFWSRFVAAPEPSLAHQLYERLVRHARFPVYYDACGVPDTPEGRFEILALHVGLAVRRLYGLGQDGEAAGQALFDIMIADLDTNLRELGVGDLSVGKQVKRLAGQFYARLAVLNEAFDDGRIEALPVMIRSNVYGSAMPPDGPQSVDRLVAIVRTLAASFDHQPKDDILAGRLDLPDEHDLIAMTAPQAAAHARA